MNVLDRLRRMNVEGRRKHRVTVRAVVLVGGALIAIAILVWLGSLVLRAILPFSGSTALRLEPYSSVPTLADRAALLQAQVQASAVLVQILGGLLLVGTLIIGLNSIRQAQQSLELNREQLRISQEGQITERFTRAIEQLGAADEKGNPRIEMRLGGIYALERIARDSCRGSKDSPDWCRDHGPIIEVLTAYVRDHAPLPEDDFDPDKQYAPRTDIQAILTVLSRRGDDQRMSEREAILLSQTNLRGVRLKHAHLEGTDLVGAHLEGADLWGAYLEGAMLIEAHLQGATLIDAHLNGAILIDAHLEGANLWGAHLVADLVGAYLQGADLMGTRLEGANLWGAHLEGAKLTTAHLEGADLTTANLQGADLRWASLEGTHLEGADLREVVNLTQDQIDQSCMDDETQLPNGPGPDGQPYRRSSRVCDKA